MSRLDLQLALGVGASGALVDVSDFVEFEDGIERMWGRDDQFYDVDAGEYSFTLNNADGRFTPENDDTVYDTPLIEGAAVCLSVDGRLTAGTVRGVEAGFLEDESTWARVVVTCDDMLGAASRRRLTSLTADMVAGAGPIALWPFNDPEGSVLVTNQLPDGRALRVVDTDKVTITFGEDAREFSSNNQARLTAAAATSGTLQSEDWAGIQNEFATPYLGVWITPLNSTSYLEIAGMNVGGLATGVPTRIGLQNGNWMLWNTSTNAWVTGAAVVVGRATHVSVGNGDGTTIGLFIDGEQVVGYNDSFVSGTGPITITVGNAAYGATDVIIGELALTAARLRVEGLDGATAADRLAALDQTASAISLSSLPAGLSDAALSSDDVDRQSLLDALNNVIRTEQGHIYAATTGTLTNPTESVVVRDRDRPAAVDYEFDVEDELQGAPEFVRSLADLVASVDVDTPTGAYTVVDEDLIGRVGDSSASEFVLLRDGVEAIAFGEDRLRRASNTQMQVQTVVVDAMTTPADRSADLLAMVAGDRIRITGLPSAQLGYTAWDGWLLGVKERHSPLEHTFEMHLQPCLPYVAELDANLYMADGELTLSSSVNSSVTSISVATTGARLSTDETPYVVQVDDEQLFVTACSNATPQVLTVVRGYNGTAAATHSSGALVDLADLRGFYAAGPVPYPSASLYPSSSLIPLGPAVSWSEYAF